ncbi:hypothetical protein KKF91_18450 [Myxococcota bacterium]|nr:hypothetical protein [Myxococcota bacterium]MBU1432524.1 hypothetical protein [Myxococcota bacterium]MBU1897882.1 hypothetical protein [Myxococcota bacterium]
MPKLLWCALALICSAPPRAAAAPPTKAALVERLGGLGQRLKRATEDLEQHLAAEDERALKALNEAQVSFFEEDYADAAARLMALTAQPGFERSRAFNEAHSALGVSLWRLGLHRLAAVHLRRALESPTPLLAPYRRALIHYLRFTAWAEPIEHARRFWLSYLDLRVSRVDAPEDEEARYLYAKALYARGDLDEATRRFSAIKDTSLFGFEAQYLRAVIHLRHGELLDARARFDAAEAIYDAQARAAAPQVEGEAVEDDDLLDGPPREIIKRALSEEEILPSEATLRRQRRGIAIHLAQARLAAAMEDEARAWRYYRKIPRGAPDYSAALTEATAILFQRGEYAWCVRQLDQLIAARGDDLSTAQLLLWQGQLLAQSGAYERAHEHYEALQAEFKAERARLDAESNPRVLFSPALLAWSAPNEVNRLRALEAELIEQEEALIELDEILAALEEIIAARGPLPVTEDRRAFIEALGVDLRQLEADLDAAELAWAEGASTSGAPSREDIEAMRQSARRAWARLKAYEARLEAFDARFSALTRQVVAEEKPKIEAARAILAEAMGAARALAALSRRRAEENLDVYAAEALFGQVDLAWWRKVEASKALTEAFKARQLDQRAVQAHEATP